MRIEAVVLPPAPGTGGLPLHVRPGRPPYVVRPDTPEHELLARAGGENAFRDLTGYPQVSLEELILRDPEVILTDPAQVENVLASSFLSGLAAVRAGRGWVTGIP